MGAIVIAAIETAIGWALRAVVLKAAIYGVALIIGQDVVGYLLPKIVGFTDLNTAFGGLSDNFWYALDYTQFSYGMPLVIEAMLARFIIRRIPFFN